MIISRNKIKVQLSLLYLLLPALCFGQVQQYTPKTAFAVETYAFLKGRSAALKSIARQFPALKSEITTATKSTAVLFARAEHNIEQFLSNELSEESFNALKNHLNAILAQQTESPIEKEQHARDFLEKISSKSSTLNDTLQSKGIISFAYHDVPHQEITDGHLKIFTTKDHPKAAETDLEIPIPVSWQAQEAEMAQTVQQFTSFHGKGIEKILVVIYDLPADQNFELDKKSVSDIIPPQTELIRTEAIKIDGRPAVMIEVEETIPHEKVKVRMLQFMFTQNRKLYCIQGSVGPVESSKNLDLHIKKYEPLFRMIASRTQIEK